MVKSKDIENRETTGEKEKKVKKTNGRAETSYRPRFVRVRTCVDVSLASSSPARSAPSPRVPTSFRIHGFRRRIRQFYAYLVVVVVVVDKWW